MRGENSRHNPRPVTAAARDEQEVAIARRLVANQACTIEKVTVVGVTHTWVVSAGDGIAEALPNPVDRSGMVRLVRVPTVAYPTGGRRRWERIWCSVWQRLRLPTARMVQIDDLAAALQSASANGASSSRPSAGQTADR